MIYIRTDMNNTIATGHMMRCLSVADALRALGEDVTFIVADEEGVELLQSRSYAYKVLQTKWNEMEQEIPIMQSYLQEKDAPLVILDSYAVTESYMRALQKVVKLVYVDDLDRFHYPVDALINYGIDARKHNYEEKYRDIPLLLGASFAPLRKCFQDCEEKVIREKVENVLLLSGGADEHHILMKLLEMVKQYSLEKITVVCGKYCNDYERLKRDYAKDWHVDIQKSIENLDVYMKEADLVISAGGSTLYELCACGTPTISFSLAENQLGNVITFAEEGIIPYAGDVKDAGFVEKVESMFQTLYQDTALRKEKATRMQNFVDGKGAIRLAEEVRKIMN